MADASLANWGSPNQAAGTPATSPRNSSLQRSGETGVIPTDRLGQSLGSTGAATNRGARIPKRELVNLTSQLAIMTRSGVDLTSSLASLARQTRRPALEATLGGVHQDLMEGNSFSDALRKYPNAFDSMYVASVAAGEATGRMPEVLAQLAKLQRTELRLRNTLRSILAYPVILLTVSSLVMLGLILFVLPEFAAIFEEFDTPLPFITRVLIDISMELRTRYWLWVPLVIFGLVGLIVLRLSPFGRRTWDSFFLNCAVLRDVTRALMIGRICRLLGLMIDSGVPLLNGLVLAGGAVRNTLYRELFTKIEQDVMNGRGMGEAMSTNSIVPPAAAEMMMTAERTGALGTVTQLIGEHYEEEGENRLRELVTVLEPAITVGMGFLVAVVVLAVMLPMFDIATFANK